MYENLLKAFIFQKVSMGLGDKPGIIRSDFMYKSKVEEKQIAGENHHHHKYLNPPSVGPFLRQYHPFEDPNSRQICIRWWQMADSTHLVVEQTNVLLDESDAEFLGRAEDGLVVLAAGGSGDVLDARAGGAEDVVDEWELSNTTSLANVFFSLYVPLLDARVM